VNNNHFKICLFTLGWPSPCMWMYSGHKALWTYASDCFSCSRTLYSSWNTWGSFL